MARPPRWKEVTALAEIMGVPALPMESPRGVDDPWLHEAVNCLGQADLVLLAGKKLDFTLKFGRPPFFARECRFAQIEVDEDQLRKDERVVLRAQADPIEAVQQLRAAARKREWLRNAWSAEVDTARRTTPVEWESLASRDPIHPLEICRAIQPYLNDGAVFVSDGGEFGQWAQAGLEARRRLINGPSGAIGSSLGLALAAPSTPPEESRFRLPGRWHLRLPCPRFRHCLALQFADCLHCRQRRSLERGTATADQALRRRPNRRLRASTVAL